VEGISSLEDLNELLPLPEFRLLLLDSLRTDLFSTSINDFCKIGEKVPQ